MKPVWLTRFLPAVLVVAGLSLAANAVGAESIVFSGTNFDIMASWSVDVGLTPLKAITLTAIGKNEALPNTFDGSKSGTGGTGITTRGSLPLLHQVWEFGTTGSVDTPTLTLLGDVPAVPMVVDTHFLVAESQILSAIAPVENKILSNATEDPRAGFGDFLSGTFSLTGDASPAWAFAYLVVPDETKIFLDFEIGAAGFSSEVVKGTFMVPEPSTPWLLTLGALALVALPWRRCRKLA